MKTVRCEIITPETVVLRDDVEFVVAPSCEGELGILPGHARLVARLRAGTVRTVKGQETKRFAVDGGFLSVSPAAVTICAPEIRSL